jgi:hypothetical protein
MVLRLGQQRTGKMADGLSIKAFVTIHNSVSGSDWKTRHFIPDSLDQGVAGSTMSLVRVQMRG